MDIPAPDCVLGYPEYQLEEILGDRIEEFGRWMRGQTFSGCDARSYNHETKEYEPSGCDIPHGFVYYQSDVRRFLAGLPVID
jgi:hypothetical protein